MKKISYIAIFTLIISLLVNLGPKGLDAMIFNIFPAIYPLFLLPFLGGILLILIQNKKRSYDFLPILLIGSFVNCIIIFLVSFLVNYLPYSDHPVLPGYFYLLQIFIPLLALSLFGGLIGLLIRGTSLVIRTKGKKSNKKLIS